MRSNTQAGQPNAAPVPARPGIRVWFRVAAIVIGVGHFWVSKYLVFGDGISYLQIADQYALGRWKLAINAYWSPLLSWLIALVSAGLKKQTPAGALQLHTINLAAYLVSLMAFEFFFSKLTEFAEHRWGKPFSQGSAYASWSLLGYAVFVWAAMGQIGLHMPVPDLILTIFVYLIFGMLLKIESGNTSSRSFGILGVTIALAYLTKAAMFPVAPVFFLAAASLVKPRGLMFRRAGLSLAVFLMVVAPWLIALHGAKGYWTTGEAGRLNYAWEVDGVTRFVHWQGEPGGFGRPEHPARKLLDAPAMYEFGEPFPVAYAPWYDPSYWYEGVAPHLVPARQIKVLWLNSLRALFLFLLVPGLLPLLVIGWRGMMNRQDVRATLFLTAPAAVTVGLYCLVFVDGRYIAPFLAVLGLTLAAPAYGRPERPWARSVVLTAALLTCGFFTGLGAAAGLFALLRDGVNGSKTFPDTTAAVANEVRGLGAVPGDKIGYIGGAAINADWARLDGLRIVAEIPVTTKRVDDQWHIVERDTSQTDIFWKSGADRQNLVFSLFRAAGARFVVAENAPEWADTSGWHKLAATDAKPVGTPFIYFRRLD